MLTVVQQIPIEIKYELFSALYFFSFKDILRILITLQQTFYASVLSLIREVEKIIVICSAHVGKMFNLNLHKI